MPLYRAYSFQTHEHLFTIDTNEYDFLGAQGWSQEGIAAYIYNDPQTVSGIAAVPLYRFFNTVTFQHLWTADPSEYSVLSGIPIWSYEGIAGYVFAQSVTGTVPFYRLFDPPMFHLWTTDSNERQFLVTNGWTDEGIAAYVFP